MPVKPTNYDEQYTGLLWGGSTIGSVAGGDLGGTLPNPTVTGINGITVLGTPTDGQELVYSSASNAWIPESEAASGLTSVTDGVITVSPVTSATVPLGGVTNLGAGSAGLNFVPNVNGALEKVHTVAVSGSSQVLDWSTANEFDLTLTATCAITFSNVPGVAGFGSSISVILRGASYGVTLPGSVTLLNADPGTALRVLVLWTTDGGTTFGGVYTGNTTLGAATPNFDSIISPAPGTAAAASHQDHVHPAGVGTFGLLVEDGVTFPPVNLYLEDGSDWLYADGPA